MADTKISGLDPAGALGGTEAFPIVQSGATRRSTIGAIRTWLTNGLGLTRATTSTVNPAASDDANAGFGAGSSWLNSATGVRWTCIDASAGAAAWVPAGSINHPGYISGSAYPVTCRVTQKSTVTANVAYAVCYHIKQRVTLSALGVQISTATAGNVIMGLYANDGGMPGAKIAETLSGSTGTAAALSLAFASNVTLPPGICWIATLFDATPEVLSIAGSDFAMTELYGGGSMASAFVASTGRQVSAAYPALPARLDGTSAPKAAATPLPSFRVA